ncbi:MAG: hypothetical protein MUP71_06415, partial [Candidatus Aminicenantes bacterium]|nr:hypothetical protein [Candidatus Aminicenantes bacterium]
MQTKKSVIFAGLIILFLAFSSIYAVKPTVNISASPERINLGKSSTLSWNSTNATSASINNDIGTVPVNGTKSVSPAATTTYIITVTGSGGKATARVKVTVLPPLPTVTFSASPGTIAQGGTSTLSWSTTSASTVTISAGVGTVPVNGSLNVSPTQTTLYVITVSGPGGTVSKSALVTVNNYGVLPTVSLGASQLIVKAGDWVTLTWISSNAETAAINNGIGTVQGRGGQKVYPSQTTTYTISVSNSVGTASSSVTIQVKSNPRCYAYVPNAGSNKVNVIDTATNTVLGNITVGNYPYSSTICADGRRVVTANSGSGIVSIYKTDSISGDAWAFSGICDYLGVNPKYIAVLPNGNDIFMASGNQLWDSGLGRYISILDVYFFNSSNSPLSSWRKIDRIIFSMAVHPSGARLYMATSGTSDPGNILVFDAKKLEIGNFNNQLTGDLSADLISSIPLLASDLAFSPDGKRLYAANSNGLTIVDVETETVIDEIPIGYIRNLKVHRDGTLIYAADAQNIYVIETATNLVSATIPLSYAKGMSLHPDGSKLYAVDGSQLKIIDTSNNTVTGTVDLGGSSSGYGNFVGYLSSVIRGMITLEGNGAEYKHISLVGNGINSEENTDVNGNYTFLVPDGTYTLQPEKITGYAYSPENLQVSLNEIANGNDFTLATVPPTAEITANPVHIPVGGYTVLEWTSTDAISANITNIGSVSPNGSRSMSPTATTTYTFTATGPGGTATAAATVSVGDELPPGIVFGASPSTIERGQSAILTWTTTNALSASIDNGIGVVPVNGSQAVAPQETTTYTITVIGPGGSNSAQVTVTV